MNARIRPNIGSALSSLINNPQTPAIVTRTTRVWKTTELIGCDGSSILHHESIWRLDENYSYGSTSFDKVHKSVAQPFDETQMGTVRRSIFHGIGQSLYDIRDYSDFTFALTELVQGLERMCLAGLVHRDINPGNCLIYEGQMKISDLENARKYIGQGKNSTPLTGTSGFMAVEYQRGHYIFQLDRKTNPDLYSRRTSSTLRFQFNFLHDLESVIWIYVWLLLDTVPGCFTNIAEDAHRDDILHLRHKLFGGSLEGSSYRFGFIQNLSQADAIRFDEVLDILSPIYGEDSPLLIGLNSFLHLANCYTEVETLPRQTALPGSVNWDAACFVHSYYAELGALFMYVHERTKTTMYRAHPLRYIANEVTNDVRPQKHRLDDHTQNVPNKRHRSLAADDPSR